MLTRFISKLAKSMLCLVTLSATECGGSAAEKSADEPREFVASAFNGVVLPMGLTCGLAYAYGDYPFAIVGNACNGQVTATYSDAKGSPVAWSSRCLASLTRASRSGRADRETRAWTRSSS